MLDVFKALLLVLYAAAMRFLGFTTKAPPFNPAHGQAQVIDPIVKVEELPAWKKQALNQVTKAIAVILESDEFTEQESILMFTMTQMEAGLMDTDEVKIWPTYEFLPDEMVKVTFVVEEIGEDGSRVSVPVSSQLPLNTISIANRPFFADYLRQLIEARALQEAVREAHRGEEA